MNSTTAPIAVLAPAYPELSETFVRREVRGLIEAGWPVTVVGLNPPGEAADDVPPADLVAYEGGVSTWVRASLRELLDHPRRSLGTLARGMADALAPGEPTSLGVRLKLPAQAVAALGVASRLRPLGVRHIHCQFAHSSATIGMYAAGQLGIPFSFVGHANDLFQRRVLLRRKLQRARFVSCISEWHKAWYARIEPEASSRLRTIRCGVDVDSWKPAPEGARDGAESFRVISVARLVAKKGLDTLIRAAALLRERIETPVELVLAGGGPEEGTLRRLAEELGVETRFMGPLANQVVRELLPQADVFALPCRTDDAGDRDGIPVSLMEAMASEVPVVVGRLPAIEELVEDGETGRLVPPDDPQALADALAGLARAPETLAALGRGGRRRVEEEFSLRVNIGRLEEELAAALEN